MTTPQQEPADAAYARHSGAAEQLLAAVAPKLNNNPTWQLEAAHVAAILALAAAVRSSGSR
jgi:hypothetical protein